MIHGHIWKEKERGIGFWEKQKGQENRIFWSGTAKACRCGEILFVTDDSRLRPVLAVADEHYVA